MAKALGLDRKQTANAIALSATDNVKGLAYPITSFIGAHAAFLAMRGITGPPEVFEGNKGFKESVSGPFAIGWLSKDTERICRTIVKKYNPAGD